MRFDALPEELVIHVTDRATANPVVGVTVHIRLLALHKNPFGCLAGPSDELGIIRVPRDRLYEVAMFEANTFLMDYIHPAEGLSGVVNLLPQVWDDLERAWNAYHENKKYYSYPDWWQPLLTTCMEAFKSVPPGIRVVAKADPGSEFRVISPPARLKPPDDGDTVLPNR